MFAVERDASGKPLEKIAAQSACSSICSGFTAYNFLQQTLWQANVDDRQVANKFSAILDNATRSHSYWLLRSPSAIVESQNLNRFLETRTNYTS
jgi:hypothetical protein